MIGTTVQRPVAVIGGGSWATAIVKMLTDNKQEVYWWQRNEEAVQHVVKFGHNPKYLSSVQLQFTAATISTDLSYILSKAEVVVLAVPSAFVKEALTTIDPKEFAGKLVVSAIKGIVPEDNLIVGEFLHKNYFVPLDSIAVITGPCHAEEVALEKLSYLTVASLDVEKALGFSQMLSNRYIKVNVSDDIYGTEYAAVLKNIFAIASGICHGLNYGDNFQAVLISNAIREIKRFVDIVHPINRDIKDSAYLGDLLVTAYSQFSRNRLFGTMIGKGYTVKSAQMEMNMIAEGYYAVNCIHQINKQYKVPMPICRTVYAILYERIAPAIEIRLLAEQLS